MIKYRVWETKDKIMTQVAGLAWSMAGIKWYGPGVGEGWCYLDPTFDWNRPNAGAKPEYVDVLEQSTGLKDKAGTDIYGGTISQTITRYDTKLSKFVYFYNEGLARFQKRRDDGEVFDCDAISEGGKVIIGTIHDKEQE